MTDRINITVPTGLRERARRAGVSPSLVASKALKEIVEKIERGEKQGAKA